MIRAANLDTETIVASLRHIMPPTALIDVGIGRGIGAMHQWRTWDVPMAWLVDAESTQLMWTETLAAQYPGWRVHSATLAEIDGQVPCYRASNPAESGLVPTSKLAALWPNLREEEHAERATTRLDTLLAREGDLTASVGCWLVVDCLPALRILQGATNTLERCSVLWLRSLLQPLPEHEAGTTLEELQVFLAPLGFRCVQVTEGNHPALGDALFVRDWAQRLQPVIAQLQSNNKRGELQYRQLETSLATQETAAKAMSQECDAQAKIAATREVQLSKLAAERAELISKLSAAEEAHGDLARKFAVVEQEAVVKSAALAAAQSETTARAEERDAQGKLAAECHAKIDELIKEKSALSNKFDALSKTHAELTEKLAVSVQQQSTTADALKAANTTLTERTSERDAHAKLATERQAKLDSISKEKADLTGKLDVLGKTYAELAQKLSASVQLQGTTAEALEAAQTALSERTDERDGQAKLAAERLAKLDTLAKDKADLSGKLDALDKTNTELAAKHTASVQQLGKTADALKAAQSTLTERTDERNARTKLATEREAKIDALVKEKSDFVDKLEGQTKLSKDRQAQFDALSKEKIALTEKLATGEKAMQELAKRNDTLQAQANQVTKARDEQAKLAAERATQVSQLSSQRDDLSKQRQALQSEVQGKDAAITTLNERIAEQDHRERQLVEEIVRAEAQIELIKDLLLREGGL